jgi:RNA polymerase-interacting CarD/CdnL/TRCF family regulator
LSNSVRSLISAREARKLLREIKHWEGEAKEQWKARADAHEAAIEGGDPFEYAKVAKELCRMESEQELRPRDKANLNRSLNLLTEEITQSLKKSPTQASKLIRQALVG